MSAYPQKRTSIIRWHVRYVPIADIRALFQRTGIDKPSIQIGRNHYRIGDGIGID